MLDPFQWLEELHSKRSLDWVETQNQRTLAEWASSSHFEDKRQQALSLLSEKDRLTIGTVYRDHVFHQWKDQENPLGIWRKASLASIANGAPNWFPLLDLDLFSRHKGIETLLMDTRFLNGSSRILLTLSPQGKDAREIKEWDLESRDFVPDGFSTSLSKDKLEWIDQDHVLWSSTEKPTHCGYASTILSWRRGQTPEIIFQAPSTSMTVMSFVYLDHQQRPHAFIFHNVTWEKVESFHWQDGKLHATGFPEDAWLLGMFQGRLVLRLKNSWGSFSSGSVVISKTAGRYSGLTDEDFETVFATTKENVVQNLAVTSQGIAIFYSHHLENKIQIWNPGRAEEASLPNGVTVSGMFSNVERNQIYTSVQSFTQPPAWYQWHESRWVQLQASKKQFVSDGVHSKQEWTISQDGTRIPYWVVYREDLPLPRPTVQLGYGGFLNSQFPSYSALVGSLWIEQGGIFVLAQIRGGGEFGVEWHASARLENKQKSYDDFIAVSEDLIRKGYTTNRQLAIRGRSNGGLLVGATITQRPDLFGAALIEVPLLDMIRYVELPPGSSWIDEYGDPRDPKMREVILRYSPYQNIERQKSYPPILIRTARSDDRVHPGHARKMAAKFQSLGHQVWFFEEELGGHVSTPVKDQAFQTALVYEFFWRTLDTSKS